MGINKDITVRINYRKETPKSIEYKKIEATLNDLIDSFCKIAMKQIDSLYLCQEEPALKLEDKSHRSFVGVELSYNKVHDLDGLFDDVKMLFEEWLEDNFDKEYDMRKLHTKPKEVTEEGWNGEL